jgi:probable HAF family extracellular repeat protein
MHTRLFVSRLPGLLAASLLMASFGARAATFTFFHLGLAGRVNGVYQPVSISTVPQSGSIGTVVGLDQTQFNPFEWVGNTLMPLFASDMAPTAISQNGAFASIGGCNGGYGYVPQRSFLFASGQQCLNVLGVNNNAIFVGEGTQTIGGQSVTRPFSVSCPITAGSCAPFYLYTLGGSYSSARAINNLNLIVGVSTNSSGVRRAMYIPVGSSIPRDFDSAHPNYSSIANAVNDSGATVGAITPGACPPPSIPVLCSQGAYSHNLPVIFTGKTGVTSLGTLGGADGAALSINAAGTIVGWSNNRFGARRAFIFANGAMTDLNANTLINGAGWTLNEADGINDNGQIVGHATGPQGQDEIFVLVP